MFIKVSKPSFAYISFQILGVISFHYTCKYITYIFSIFRSDNNQYVLIEIISNTSTNRLWSMHSLQCYAPLLVILLFFEGRPLDHSNA